MKRKITIDISDIQFGFSGIVHDFVSQIQCLSNIPDLEIEYLYIRYYKFIQVHYSTVDKEIASFIMSNGLPMTRIHVFDRNIYLEKVLNLLGLSTIYFHLSENEYLLHSQFRLIFSNSPARHFVRLYDMIFRTHPELMSKSSFNKYLYSKIVISLIKRKYMVLSDSMYSLVQLTDFEKTSNFHLLPCMIKDGIQVIAKSKLPYEYILHVSTLEPKKNQMFLLDVFEELKKDGRYKDLKLVIIGKSGWNVSELIKRIKLTEDVIWIQNASDAERNEYYINAKLFVFPSIVEGFGIPPLEAMSYHIPVLSSEIPVHREVQGNASFYARLGDIEDFVSKISFILDPENQDQVNEQIRKGQEHINKFSKSTITELWRSFLS